MTITRGTSVEPAWRFLAFADPNKSNVVSLDTDDNEITLFCNKYAHFFMENKCWWGMSLSSWVHHDTTHKRLINAFVDACYLMKSRCFVTGLDVALRRYCRAKSGAAIDVSGMRVG